MQTLLIFSHTFWKDSKVNRALLESASNAFKCEDLQSQ